MFKDRYTVMQDDDGVLYRVERDNPNARTVKLLDPNFVHERVPLPGRVGGTDALQIVAATLILVIVAIVGGIVGSERG